MSEEYPAPTPEEIAAVLGDAQGPPPTVHPPAPFEVKMFFRNGPLTGRVATATLQGDAAVGDIVTARCEVPGGMTSLAYRIQDNDVNRMVLRERGGPMTLAVVHVPYAERFVVYQEEDGIFLGAWLGLGFWTKLDPAGQREAVTFESPAAFNKWVEELRQTTPEAFAQPYELRPVKATVYDRGVWYATIDDCKAAGLPGWMPYPLNPL